MQSVPEIDVREAHRQAEENTATLLDVREPMEWETGHAPGAEWVPLGQLDPGSLNKDLTYSVICRSGARSADATARLCAVGFDANNVSGGMSAWEIEGLPVVASDGSPGLVI